MQPSSIDKDPVLAHQLFENVVTYSPLAKVYMQPGQLQSPFNDKHRLFHSEKNMPPFENQPFEAASTSQGIFFEQRLLSMQPF